MLIASDGSAETDIHAAAWSGEVDFLKELVGKGESVNQVDSIGEIPLHGACAWGHAKAVAFLLEHGSDCHVMSKGGEPWKC